MLTINSAFVIWMSIDSVEVNVPERTMEKLIQKIVVFMPVLGVSLLIFLAFWLVAVIFQKIIHRIGERSVLNPDIVDLLARIVKAGIVVFGNITAHGTAHVKVSALVASLGLTGFALGFALKDALSNTLAGVLILIYQPFRRGDHIIVSGFDGTVDQIDLRYTTLSSAGDRILIPNSTMFTNPIKVVGVSKP
jgi:small conductance mechanosensitive channel